MGCGKPAANQQVEPKAAPPVQFLAELAGQVFGEMIAVWCRAKRSKGSRLASFNLGRIGKVYANPDDYRIADPLQQNTSQLGCADHQVIGPFEQRSRGRRNQGRNNLVQGQSAEQSQTGCGWIVGAKVDHRRPHEVAETIEPGPALPPFSRRLAISHQPFAFGQHPAAAG